MNLFLVTVASLLALAWWMFRKPGGLQALTVTGGTVTIDESVDVEERRVWQYTGETTELWQALNARGSVPQLRLQLINGALYDVIPVAPIQGEPLPPLKGRPDGLIGFGLSGFPNGIERGRWVASWRPVVLTVQEQLAGQVKIVPNAFRIDDTEPL